MEALEPVRTGVGNLDFTGIRSTDYPARSESLYRLNYPDPRSTDVRYKNVDLSWVQF